MRIPALCLFQFSWILALPSCNGYLDDVLRYEISPFGVPAARPAVDATGYNKWVGRIVSIGAMYGGKTADENVLGVVELQPITGTYYFYHPSDRLIPLVDERGNFVMSGAGHKEQSPSERIEGRLIKKSVKINRKSYDYVIEMNPRANQL